jgi:hypothetical protein
MALLASHTHTEPAAANDDRAHHNIAVGDYVRLFSEDCTEQTAAPVRVRLVTPCGTHAYLDDFTAAWPTAQMRSLWTPDERAWFEIYMASTEPLWKPRPRGRPRKDRTESRCTTPFNDVATQISTIGADLDKAARSKLRMDLKKEAIRLINTDRRIRPSAAKVLHEVVARLNWDEGRDWHGIEHFQGACGLHRRTVITAFKEGAKCGNVLRRQTSKVAGGYRSETTLPISLAASESMVAKKSQTTVVEKSETTVVEKSPSPSMLVENGKHGGHMTTLTSKGITKSSVLANARTGADAPERLEEKRTAERIDAASMDNSASKVTQAAEAGVLNANCPQLTRCPGGGSLGRRVSGVIVGEHRSREAGGLRPRASPGRANGLLQLPA